MANTQHDTTVPRAKVVQIAESFHQLMTLRDQQAHTQAQMIRGCVQAIRRSLRTQPTYVGGMLVARAKINHDRDLALLYLETLATQLEDSSSHKE